MIEILVWIGVGVAASITPAFLVYYGMTHVPERRREIESLLRAKTDQEAQKIADKYEEIFPAGVRGRGAGEKGPGEARLLGRFDDFHSLPRYLTAGLVALIPTATGLVMTGAWSLEQLSGGKEAVGRIPTPIVLAFLGGYVWTLYDLIDSGRRGDLAPSRLFMFAFRVVASIPIGYAFSLIAIEAAAGFAAFAASAFPLRTVRLMTRSWLIKRMEASPAATGSGREDYLRDRVQGVSSDTLARLQDMEIATVLDMAYADPFAIVVETGFSLRQVIDWIDQSLLALYAGDKISHLPRIGIRGALHASHVFEEKVAELQGKDWEIRKNFEKQPMVLELVRVLGVSAEAVANLLAEVQGDPHVELLSLLWGEVPGGAE